MSEVATTVLSRIAPGTAGGSALAYCDAGPRTASAVVLLHSLGTDSRLWQHQTTSLAESYRVVAPDSRGHGSSGWVAPLTVAGWVSDLERVLDHASVTRAWLVGISMGGVQALAYAAAHADRVAGLVIADSFARLPAATAAAKTEWLARQAEQHGMAGLARAYITDTFTTHPLPTAARVVSEAISGMARHAYLASTHTCFHAQLTDRLPGITAPTLVLWGDRDTKTPRNLSEEIATGIPDARLEVIPAAGHLSNLENPTAFTAAVHRFLATAAGSSTAAEES